MPRRSPLLVLSVLSALILLIVTAIASDQGPSETTTIAAVVEPVPPLWPHHLPPEVTLVPGPKAPPPTTTTTTAPPPPAPVAPPPPAAPPTTEGVVHAAAVEPEPAPPPPPPAAAPAPSGAVGEVLAMHNSERSARGLAPLTLSSCLNGVAQGWADHMAATQQLGHNPNGLSQSSDCSGGGPAGENVAYDTTLSGMHSRWMSSSGHASNILSPNYHYIGIGVAQSADGYYWVTVDFAT